VCHLNETERYIPFLSLKKQQNLQRLFKELDAQYARRDQLWADLEQSINQSGSSHSCFIIPVVLSAEIILTTSCFKLPSPYQPLKISQRTSNERDPLWKGKVKNWTRKLPTLQRRKCSSGSSLIDWLECVPFCALGCCSLPSFSFWKVHFCIVINLSPWLSSSCMYIAPICIAPLISIFAFLPRGDFLLHRRAPLSVNDRNTHQSNKSLGLPRLYLSASIHPSCYESPPMPTSGISHSPSFTNSAL